MKLEPDLIREILLFTEAIPAGEYQDIPALGEYDQMTVNCHVKHLHAAGYLEGNIVEDQVGRPAYCRITDLSWKGHEFLNLARNNEGWAWAKRTFTDKAISISVSVLTRALESYTLLQLGIK
jgi:hypothetical protein